MIDEINILVESIQNSTHRSHIMEGNRSGHNGLSQVLVNQSGGSQSGRNDYIRESDRYPYFKYYSYKHGSGDGKEYRQ